LETTVRTATTADVLHHVAGEIRRPHGQLTGRLRTRAEIPPEDVFPGGVRRYNPATGPGSPVAPPMRVTPDGDGGVVGHCTIGIVHEGPPGFGHGGMSALLLDELMGWACYEAGTTGMTVSLQMRYRRPVPVEVPLRAHHDERRIRPARGPGATAGRHSMPRSRPNGSSTGSRTPAVPKLGRRLQDQLGSMADEVEDEVRRQVADSIACCTPGVSWAAPRRSWGWPGWPRPMLGMVRWDYRSRASPRERSRPPASTLTLSDGQSWVHRTSL